MQHVQCSMRCHVPATGWRNCAPACCPRCLSQVPGDPVAYEALWQDYLVFGVARNPWRRAVSSYRMLAHYLRNEPECHAALGWDAFCREPARMAMVHNQYPGCDTLK